MQHCDALSMLIETHHAMHHTALALALAIAQQEEETGLSIALALANAVLAVDGNRPSKTSSLHGRCTHPSNPIKDTALADAALWSSRRRSEGLYPSVQKSHCT